MAGSSPAMTTIGSHTRYRFACPGRRTLIVIPSTLLICREGREHGQKEIEEAGRARRRQKRGPEEIDRAQDACAKDGGKIPRAAQTQGQGGCAGQAGAAG